MVIHRGKLSDAGNSTLTRVEIYLIDGTYELFRHFFAMPSAKDGKGQEVGAVRGVLNSIRGMLDRGVTHIGVATDHVIESFRNNMYPGYKTGAGIPPELYAQFPILEQELETMGITVWPMIEFEADDALASAAEKAVLDDASVEWSFAPPTRISANAFAELESFNSIAERIRLRMKTPCRPNSASSLNRFPTTSPWSATLPTVSQAFRVGERKPPRPYLSKYPQLEKDYPRNRRSVTARPRPASTREFSVFSVDRCAAIPYPGNPADGCGRV